MIFSPLDATIEKVFIDSAFFKVARFIIIECMNHATLNEAEAIIDFFTVDARLSLLPT